LPVKQRLHLFHRPIAVGEHDCHTAIVNAGANGDDVTIAANLSEPLLGVIANRWNRTAGRLSRVA